MRTEPRPETAYSAMRLTIETDAPFEDFQRRYEAAVPRYDAQAFAALAERKASWSEVLDLTNRLAPLGFLIYHRLDAQPMMSLAGDSARCVEYLMGNHTIAERMFRHDPIVLMYVPLRTVVSAGDDEVTRFSIDQPSSTLASFDNPEIAQVGAELDSKVARLLEHLAVPVPPSLTAAR